MCSAYSYVIKCGVVYLRTPALKERSAVANIYDKRTTKTQRTTVRVNRGELWALKYISALTSNNIDDLLREGWRRGIEFLNNPKKEISSKPKALSNNTIVKVVRYPIDYKLKTMMVLYNRELITWGQSDVIRLGLRRMIKDYSVRHPELNKIIKRYESEEE